MKKKLTHIVIIITIIFIDILTGMEFDLFVPSLSQLQHYFHLSPFWAEAAVTINFIGYCISLFLVGELSDRFGRKPIIIWGLVLFIIGSGLCLIKFFYLIILIGRFLQGFGIAAPAILSFLIIADRYSLTQQQFWMAMLNGSYNTAAGIAPVVGSYIALYFQWQGSFIALLVLGLIAFMMTLFFLPQESKSQREPSGYTELFHTPSLLLLIATLAIMFTPYWVFSGISPLLYIKNLHVSFPAFGIYQGSLALFFALGSILFGFILKLCSPKNWLYVGLLFFMMALLSIIWISFINSASPMIITSSMLIFVIAQIIPSTILYPLCLNYIPHAKAKISALTQGASLVISALSLQIAGYFYQGSFQSLGIILIMLISLTLLTQYWVIRDSKIIQR
ncbi:MAG: MFS transporter [Legionellales bacterium]|nr:MFS transporter [Legionellales bacterium]